MAEAVGFEPTVGFPPRSVSNRVLSASQPRLRRISFSGLQRGGQEEREMGRGFVAAERRMPREEKLVQRLPFGLCRAATLANTAGWHHGAPRSGPPQVALARPRVGRAGMDGLWLAKANFHALGTGWHGVACPKAADLSPLASSCPTAAGTGDARADLGRGQPLAGAPPTAQGAADIFNKTWAKPREMPQTSP